jgi:hypothetical protein
MTRFIAGTLVAGLLFVTGTGGRADPPPPSSPETRPEAARLNAKAMQALTVEHSRARDALLAAEARLALLMEKTFNSKLIVRYHGDLDRSFQLARLELLLDGAMAYQKSFHKAASVQALKLYDGHLPPGRHVVQVRVYARGSDDPSGSLPGYFAGSGLAVHLRPNSVTEAVFEAEQDGDTLGQAVLKEEEPEGSWEVEIEGSYETVSR